MYLDSESVEEDCTNLPIYSCKTKIGEKQKQREYVLHRNLPQTEQRSAPGLCTGDWSR